jgi:membrane-bound lytic murein transglycosylase A
VLALAPSTVSAELTPVKAPAVTVACDDLELTPLAEAIESEIDHLKRHSGTLRIGARAVSNQEYVSRTLEPIAKMAREGDRTKLCGWLLYRMGWNRVGREPVLFTAYHTPTVRGSLTADDTYRYPLYRRPRDTRAGYTTAQILGGALRGFELAWLADPYDVLALHVEGAGNIQLPDGRNFPVGTDGNNGHPYTNVSKLLIADGKLPPGPPPRSDQPGNPKARKYFSEHPADLNVYWGRNPHFVFFKQAEKAGSGKMGLLVPGRSVAVDESQVPIGSLIWIHTQKPVVSGGAVTGWEPMSRLVLGQDTGAGIRGQRMDVFFGDDEYALAAAQVMSVQGEAYVLVGN